MGSIKLIHALEDNYIFIYRYDGNNSLVIDPGDAHPVLDFASEHGIEIKAILNSHYHFDHVDGNEKLKKDTGCGIFGPDPTRIPGLDQVVQDREHYCFGPVEIEVISTPGHTESDVSYFMKRPDGGPVLWTGDTLFVGGCGRVYGGGAKALFHSLKRLASLPEETLVYCGHEYGGDNFRFALTIEPDNKKVRARYDQIIHMRQLGRPSVPSTIAQEMETNIFLRSGERDIKKALGMDHSDSFEVFAELRRRKDIFQ